MGEKVSDGFSFVVKYACMTCEQCPDYFEYLTESVVRKTCNQPNGPRDFTGVWVTDEIHPECPHRKEQQNV